MSVKLVLAEVPTCTPSRYTTYAVTRTSSLAAVQLKSMRSVPTTSVAVSPPGTLGAVVSGIVAIAAADWADSLPAASRALTV